jgi:hypothetical protein
MSMTFWQSAGALSAMKPSDHGLSGSVISLPSEGANKLSALSVAFMVVASLISGNVHSPVPRLLSSAKPQGIVFLDIEGTPLGYTYALAFRDKSEFLDEFAHLTLDVFSRCSLY